MEIHGHTWTHMDTHPLLPSAVGLVRRAGNFPGSSPWEAQCRSQAESRDVLDGRETWDQERASGFGVLTRTSISLHVEVEGTFPWEALGRCQCQGHCQGASLCQVLSPEKCQQNFQAAQPPLSRTVPCQGEHSGFKAWQTLVWLIRLGVRAITKIQN